MSRRGIKTAGNLADAASINKRLNDLKLKLKTQILANPKSPNIKII